MKCPKEKKRKDQALLFSLLKLDYGYACGSTYLEGKQQHYHAC